jgi:hypothetical protein
VTHLFYDEILKQSPSPVKIYYCFIFEIFETIFSRELNAICDGLNENGNKFNTLSIFLLLKDLLEKQRENFIFEEKKKFAQKNLFGTK